jgi:hypothetical protein
LAVTLPGIEYKRNWRINGLVGFLDGMCVSSASLRRPETTIRS